MKLPKIFLSYFQILCLTSVVLSAEANRLHPKEKYEEKLNNHIIARNSAEIGQHAPIGATKCMGDLGCFSISRDFFHLLYRPINFLPNDRLVINTKFHLYTRKNPKEYWTLSETNPEGIRRSPLDERNPTRFIVHGFLDNKWYGKWMEILKDNLLLHSDNNVIIVDWSGGNSLPYTQATANTRVVGAEIALMINRLMEVKNVSFSDCHIIGHSLGAHAAGYAGERIKNLGRISGIDPAEPFFQYMPPKVRLDSTDADFVDVIHTDAVSILLLGLGMSQAIGHVDFYPNNGKNQPGCKADAIRSLFLEGLIEATRRFASCSHQRGVDFFIYSINYRRAPPIGYHCPSWLNYTNAMCTSCGEDGSKCAVMGLRADEYKKHKNDSQSLKMYLKTSGLAPYWVHQYKVTVKLSNSNKKMYDQKGTISTIFHGKYGDMETQWPDRPLNLVPGQSYSFITQSKNYLGSFETLTFSWKSSTWNFFKTKMLYIDYVEIIPLNVIDRTEKKIRTRVFCDGPETSVGSNKILSLPACTR